MKEVEIALEVDAVATSELNVEVPYHHGWCTQSKQCCCGSITWIRIRGSMPLD
jgi:hypothetical protein